MKRMITMCLMTMLMLSLVLTVYGDEHDGSTQVFLEISDTYVTSIPPTVSFDSTMGIEISDKVSSDEVVVFVSSKNFTDIGSLCLTNGSKRIGYSINSDNTITSSSFYDADNFNYLVAELARFRENKTILLSFSINDYLSSFESGVYSDTLTFHFR